MKRGTGPPLASPPTEQHHGWILGATTLARDRPGGFLAGLLDACPRRGTAGRRGDDVPDRPAAGRDAVGAGTLGTGTPGRPAAVETDTAGTRRPGAGRIPVPRRSAGHHRC